MSNEQNNEQNNEAVEELENEFDAYSHYESDEDGDILYPLKKPFTEIKKNGSKAKNESVTVETLVIRAPNGADLRATQDLGPQEAAYIQIQRCSRLKTQSFDKLSTKDIHEISNIVNFLAEA